jgi:hypothetical protein
MEVQFEFEGVMLTARPSNITPVGHVECAAAPAYKVGIQQDQKTYPWSMGLLRNLFTTKEHEPGELTCAILQRLHE